MQFGSQSLSLVNHTRTHRLAHAPTHAHAHMHTRTHTPHTGPGGCMRTVLSAFLQPWGASSSCSGCGWTGTD